MPDGEMRRPPQLWEQRLARTTAVLGVGISSTGGGDATAVVPPQPVPGEGGGIEPSPVLPPPGDFIKPSTPTLLGSVQGINVLWDGLNSAGDLWPYDTSWVEVHMATSGTGFVAGTATLKGRLARPGAFFVGGLTAGTTYYFKLRGADPAGNYTEASDAASGLTGLTTASDYGTATIGTGAVSFNARTIGGVTNSVQSTTPSNPVQGDVWLDTSPGTAVIHKVYNGSTWVTNAWGSASIAAGQITALQIAAGAITAGAIAADAITGKTITGGTVNGSQIIGGTITGGYISGGTINGGYISGGTMVSGVLDSASLRTASSGARIELGNFFSSLSAISLYNSSGFAGSLITNIGGGIAMASVSPTKTSLGNVSGGVELVGPSTCTSTFDVTGNISGGGGLDITGAAVDLPGASGNAGATTADAGFNGNRLRAKTSTQRVKYDIAEVDGTLTDIEPGRRSDIVTIDPHDVLDLGVAEFTWVEDDEPTEWRSLGWISDDVAAKFPVAASRDAEGRPFAVNDTPILASLLAVVREQQATITDLRTRIEALEA